LSGLPQLRVINELVVAGPGELCWYLL